MLNDHQLAARDIFRELIEIDTTDATGDNDRAAHAMARRLVEAGLPTEDVRVLGPVPRKGNLVARMRGSGKRRPLLMLAHLDVVEADPSEWATDPFAFVEQDDHYYGRGTTDDKAMAAIWVANLVRYLREGFVPDRDLILALTADEEGGQHNGASWLLEEHRDLVDAAFGLNEGGTGASRTGATSRTCSRPARRFTSTSSSWQPAAPATAPSPPTTTPSTTSPRHWRGWTRTASPRS